ncbi:MAG: hypothetical protein IJY11_03940 [Clostridia bacterium]|nr:hypothetical protein [Clostridia bacterium]
MESIKKYAPVLASVCGVFTLLMLFMPSVVMEVYGIQVSFSGFDTAFGCKMYVDGQTTEMFSFSFFNIMPWLLTAMGMVFCVMVTLEKAEKKCVYVATVLFLLAAIFFFLSVVCVSIPNASSPDEVKSMMDLGAGAVFSGIFSLLSAGLTLTPLVLEKMGK